MAKDSNYESFKTLKDSMKVSIESSQNVIPLLHIVLPMSSKRVFSDVFKGFTNIKPIYVDDQVVDKYDCWVLKMEALKIHFLSTHQGRNVVYVELDMIFKKCMVNYIESVFKNDFDLCLTYKSYPDSAGSMNTGVILYKNVDQRIINFERVCLKRSEQAKCAGGLNQNTYDKMGLKSIPYYNKLRIHGIIVMSIPMGVINNTNFKKHDDNTCIYHFKGGRKKEMLTFES